MKKAESLPMKVYSFISISENCKTPGINFNFNRVTISAQQVPWVISGSCQQL